MNKSFSFFAPTIISVFVLLFCVTFTLTFYNSLSKEYEYNLRIDRGFVSGDALYFSADANADPRKLASGSAFVADTTLLDIFSRFAGKDSFLLASQIGNTRAVYYQGDFTLPPIQSGRFFTSEECMSSHKLAVIGKASVDQTWKDPVTNRTMISLELGDFEVIGVMGMEKVSTIDTMAFVNIGSIEENSVLLSVLYIDSYAGNSGYFFERLAECLTAETDFTPKIIDMPFTATDVVSGGVFMASIMKLVIYAFLFLSFLCTLVFSILANQTKICVYLLTGHTYLMTLVRVSVPVLISGSAGISLALISGVILERIQYFHLPSTEVYASLTFSCVTGLSLLLIFPFSQYCVIRSANLSESLR